MKHNIIAEYRYMLNITASKSWMIRPERMYKKYYYRCLNEMRWKGKTEQNQQHITAHLFHLAFSSLFFWLFDKVKTKQAKNLISRHIAQYVVHMNHIIAFVCKKNHADRKWELPALHCRREWVRWNPMFELITSCNNHMPR